MSTKQIKPTSGSTRRIQGDPNGQQIRLGLNQEPPSNSRHLQEQIETKNESAGGGIGFQTGNQKRRTNRKQTARIRNRTRNRYTKNLFFSFFF